LAAADELYLTHGVARVLHEGGYLLSSV